MNPTTIKDLSLGPHTELAKRLLYQLDSAQFLRFQGHLGSSYQPIVSFSDAIDSTHEHHDDGLDWISLRDMASAYANGGSSFIYEAPWSSHIMSIRSVYELLDRFVGSNLPQKYSKIADDVYADLRSCIDCGMFHGGFDDFHQLLWDAYIQGGWPCGWMGEFEEQEDGGFRAAEATLKVFWEVNGK